MNFGDEIEFFNLIITALIVLIVVAFVRLVFWGDNKERTFQKIIGGFAVFIVALLSKHPVVIGISLFIGGLIIASEHFMKMLAAILRADSKDIKDLIRIESATPEELQQKQEEEQKDVEKTIEPELILQNKNERIIPASVQASFVVRRSVEKKVAEALVRKFGASYESNAKIVGHEQKVVFDGVITSTNVESNVMRNPPVGVEIKYIPRLRRDSLVLDMLVPRTLGRIWANMRYVKILFVLVGNNLIKSEAEEIYAYLHQNYRNVYFALYSYIPDKNEVEEMIISPSFINRYL